MRRWLPLAIVPPTLLGAGGFLWALVSLTLHVRVPSDFGWLSPRPAQAAELAKAPEPAPSGSARAVPAAPTPAAHAEPTPCGGFRVVLTVADSDAPRQSMAVVSAKTGQGMVRPGELLGGRPVLAVTPMRVWLGGPDLCYLDELDHAPVGKPDKRKAPLVIAGGDVERIDDRHVRVDRSVRDRLLETGGADLGKTFRVVPEVVDGKMLGMRVLGVQEGSLLAKLGLRAGDRLRAVNGLPLGGPEQLLELYARLRTAPHLELELVRDGAKKVLEVEVI